MEKFWNWMEKHETVGGMISWMVLFATHPIRSGCFWWNYLKGMFTAGWRHGCKYGPVMDDELQSATVIAIWDAEFEKAFGHVV